MLHLTRALVLNGKYASRNNVDIVVKGTQTEEWCMIHHYPEYIPATARKICATRKCKVCASKGFRKETRYYCVSCNAGLCVTPCFKEFHMKVNMRKDKGSHEKKRAKEKSGD